MTKLIHRRSALLQLGAGLTGLIVASRAEATPAGTVQYFYDGLGRVIRVYYRNSSNVVVGAIVYSYDDAGNRTQVARTSSAPATTWTQTIAITGAGPVDLYSLATAAGYAPTLADGTPQDANVTFTLASGVTVTGAGAGLATPSVAAIDTGAWPINQVYVVLALQISGVVRGGGGTGGEGNSGPGFDGSDAINCRAPMGITVNSGAVVKSGGGGGGGGLQSVDGRFGGGGGGGGAANGAPGGGGEGDQINGHAGSSGTTTGGGAGGARGASPATAGGAGGNYATAGANGVSGGGSGGAAGYAVRKNGFAVGVTNNGTISGTVG